MRFPNDRRAPRGARPFLRAAALAASLCTAACSSGGDGDGKTDLEAFVRAQLAATAENTDPLSLDGIVFRFEEDPDAFDDLFP